MRSLCDSTFLLAKVFSSLSFFYFGAEQKSVFDSGIFQLYSKKVWGRGENMRNPIVVGLAAAPAAAATSARLQSTKPPRMDR